MRALDKMEKWDAYLNQFAQFNTRNWKSPIDVFQSPKTLANPDMHPRS